MGSKKRNLDEAIRRLSASPGVRVLKISPFYRTEPVGGPKQGDYINAVIQLSVNLSPSQLLNLLMDVERDMGRKRRRKWGPRLIDLDLLTYGRLKMQSRMLTLPHPRYHLRRFVLVPLCDLAPRQTHPGLRKSHRTLLNQLTVKGQKVRMLKSWKSTQY